MVHGSIAISLQDIELDDLIFHILVVFKGFFVVTKNPISRPQCSVSYSNISSGHHDIRLGTNRPSLNRQDQSIFFFSINDLLPTEAFIALIFLAELVKDAVFSLVVCQVQDVGLTRFLLLRLRLLCVINFLIGKHLVFELGEINHREKSLMNGTVLLLIDALILRISVEKRLNLVFRVLLSQLSINQLVEDVDICAEN